MRAPRAACSCLQVEVIGGGPAFSGGVWLTEAATSFPYHLVYTCPGHKNMACRYATILYIDLMYRILNMACRYATIAWLTSCTDLQIG